MWWMLLTALAHAASPGGFRVGPGLPVRAVGARQVVVVDLAGGWVTETVPWVRMSGGGWSVDLQLPVVANGGADFAHLGVGQFRLAGWRHFARGPRFSNALGVEIGGPSVPHAWRTQAWGSLPRDTLVGTSLGVAWQAAFDPDHPVVLRAVIGWQRAEHIYFGPSATPLLEAAIALVRPVAGAWSAVFEGEVLTDTTPLSVRALARFDTQRASLDFGLAVPWHEVGYREPVLPGLSVHAVAQARAFF